MKGLRLDSILLFALVIPFIMGYRIGPGDTPFLLFGFIFVLLLSYVGLDLFGIRERMYDKLKLTVLWLTIIFVVGSGFFATIVVRHQTAPTYMIHDIILQQEAAVRFLLHGKNPYQETYFGTPLEQFHYDDREVNPALYHFVMEPFYLIFAVPFYVVSNHLLGFFDGRMPLLVLFGGLLLVAALLIKDQEKKRLLLILFAFHPSLLPYTLEGRSDIFMFAFLFLGVSLVYWRRETLSAIAFGLAFAVKQSAWPFFPFYVAYLYFTKKSWRQTCLTLLPFLATFVVISLPFFLWNPGAYYDSTIAYLSGNTQHSYPISGYGLGSLLLQLGIIHDKFIYYPFAVWQLVFSLPILGYLLFRLKKEPSMKNAVIFYAIFLFVFWYLSRYFNNSHIAYISYVFIAAFFLPDQSEARGK